MSQGHFAEIFSGGKYADSVVCLSCHAYLNIKQRQQQCILPWTMDERLRSLQVRMVRNGENRAAAGNLLRFLLVYSWDWRGRAVRSSSGLQQSTK